MARRDAAIRRCSQEWVDNGKFQLHDGSNDLGPQQIARLWWCLARSGQNQADWGRIVLSDGSRFQLCPDDHRKRVWRYLGSRAYLISLLNATQALNKELWSEVSILLTAGPLWSSLESSLQPNHASMTF
ncbi:hypothetical protein TNCV_888911 [Trichonephila clavipes]|nr:hypothetical protein TNCV_888911 [Trichonephila clavipes]